VDIVYCTEAEFSVVWKLSLNLYPYASILGTNPPVGFGRKLIPQKVLTVEAFS